MLSLWVVLGREKFTMYINWKALFIFGFAFWGLLYSTDLLGESSWKKCSAHVDDILQDQFDGMLKMQKNKLGEPLERQRMNWSMLLWNICAFLCSLLFCSVIKMLYWFVCRLFKTYNVYRNREAITNRLKGAKGDQDTGKESNKPNCKILFRNELFVSSKQDINLQDQSILAKELENLKKEKEELSQQLMIAQKENLTTRQQMEEYKLENFIMKDKLSKKCQLFRDNSKSKSSSEEIIVRRAHSLEVHLKEISKDRDLLRNKLSNLETSYSKLQERLNMYEEYSSETKAEQEVPEKDTRIAENEAGDSETGMNICKFQKMIMNVDKDDEKEKQNEKVFEGNSKISVDLEDSSFESSKETEPLPEKDSETKNSDIETLKQNILNYSKYRAQMLRPKFSIKDRWYETSDYTGSLSDENSSCHRIISSTVEFQNFLKTLSSKSAGDIECYKNLY